MSTLALSDISQRRRATWHLFAAVLIAVWALTGFGLLLASAAGVAVTWWAIVHPFTLGGLTTAVIVYSTHFTEALTRTPAASCGPVAARVLVLQAGILLLLLGDAGPAWSPLADAGAAAVIVVSLWHGVALWRRLRGSLAGSVVVTVPFYLVAAGFLVLAVVFAWAAGRGVGSYDPLIAAHSRATVWGFTWLTVLGTIVSLLPTLSGAQISARARARCTRSLVVHSLGVVGAMVLLLIDARLAALPLLLTVVAAVLLVQPILGAALHGSRWRTSGIGVSAGVLWMIALSTMDAVALARGVDPRETIRILVPALLGAGLLQLVTSVLLHLLPILAGAGPPRADRGGVARLVLINLGGIATLISPGPAGLILMALGLLLQGGALVAAVVPRNRKEPS
ncbi:MAG: beta-carotene 15,15'-monooxygenase [Corynebacterium sp.]|uniref:beta-carotene 15,15'-monooxygenase n=1 Tax=Corynebacterium sp. TaxID=1720 RepID=UPI0026E0F3EE|nr:beta-carotene 15,15'-monooxygenase [Corynebacterium sp.]MDO5670469.1 beta-carotene 15,15'-monooxygenase [Corynebacterium sp.]